MTKSELVLKFAKQHLEGKMAVVGGRIIVVYGENETTKMHRAADRILAYFGVYLFVFTDEKRWSRAQNYIYSTNDIERICYKEQDGQRLIAYTPFDLEMTMVMNDYIDALY
jgi:hypothetical protein